MKKKITTKPALNESWYPACIFIDSIQEWNPLQALLFTPPCICELVSGTWRNQRLWYLFTHTCQWWHVNFQWTTTIPQSQTLSAHLWKQSCERKTRLLPLLDIFPIGFPVSYCCILEHSPPFPQTHISSCGHSRRGTLAIELDGLLNCCYQWCDLGMLLPLWDLAFLFKMETGVPDAVEVLSGEEHREETEELRVQLRQQSACPARVRPWVRTFALHELGEVVHAYDLSTLKEVEAESHS